MQAKYLVLDKETVRVVLTKAEYDILNTLVTKINKWEGLKKYTVEEIK